MVIILNKCNYIGLYVKQIVRDAFRWQNKYHHLLNLFVHAISITSILPRLRSMMKSEIRSD